VTALIVALALALVACVNQPAKTSAQPAATPSYAAPVLTPAEGPEVPADLRRQHAHGRVIVAGVVERNATVSHAKVVGSSGYPAFDEAARSAVAEMRYNEPTRLDGEPIRCFAYMVIDFEAR
jgi:TonB family protein